MIDFTNIKKYKENNRIEAKKAIGGFPQSIWETYSAFANTYGGVILLGVEEKKDKTLHSVGLPDPEGLVEEFWSIINNTKKVSVNILLDTDVTIEKSDEKPIVVIYVPRAQRCDRPVYIDNNPISGTYRRSGEGDYRCTSEEVEAMLRDASVKTQDMQIIDDMTMDVFNFHTVKAYRARMEQYHPSHMWEKETDEGFLQRLGAVGIGKDGKPHPTGAGLLMFGRAEEIVKKYPSYRLDYREILEESKEAVYSISSDCDESGNVYDFFFGAYSRIKEVISPEENKSSVHKALKEGLANCLINADYYGKAGVEIVRKKEEISFSNPGGFRVDMETAKRGGVSDPRNSLLIKMFNLVDTGRRSGSGIPGIYGVWKNMGWVAPVITENLFQNRITLTLPLTKNKIEKSDTKKTPLKTDIHKKAVISYLTDNVSANTWEIAKLLGVKPERARRILSEMMREGTITKEGGNRNRRYRLEYRNNILH